MVGAKTLKDYGFSSIEDYHEMIIESKVNGQIAQSCKQFSRMDKEQKKDFLSYLTDEVERNSNGNTVYYQLLKLLIEHI